MRKLSKIILCLLCMLLFLGCAKEEPANEEQQKDMEFDPENPYVAPAFVDVLFEKKAAQKDDEVVFSTEHINAGYFGVMSVRQKV